jgi:hypothetical protein
MHLRILPSGDIEYPFAPQRLRAEHPNTSFPKVMSPDLLAKFGVFVVEPTSKPETTVRQKVVEGLPEFVALAGVWRQTWNVLDLDVAELVERRERLTTRTRERRDALLAASDWTQVADVPVDKAAWAIYRQALRDLPAQKDFPLSVVWPEPPAR